MSYTCIYIIYIYMYIGGQGPQQGRTTGGLAVGGGLLQVWPLLQPNCIFASDLAANRAVWTRTPWLTPTRSSERQI